MEAILHGVDGFMYPNEVELQWSMLIVLYPYITGWWRARSSSRRSSASSTWRRCSPTYRLALLTALAFLLVAPLPLQLHLGHPERSFEMYLTPHTTSAMAMFGFVYLWYLMVVLCSRSGSTTARTSCCWRAASTGWQRCSTASLTLGSDNISPQALRDRRQGRPLRHHHRHPVGVPAARVRRLHLRLGQGQPLVVDAADADRLPLLGHGLGHRRWCCCSTCVVCWLRRAIDRHALPRHDRAVPLLHLRHRFLAGDARPDPPHLRGRRVLPEPRLHGAHAAVHVADRRCRSSWAR